MTRQAVQSLWIGQRLSAMEQLAIASFLQHGHEYHLYVYGPVAGVPKGACLLDANEILPADTIFVHRSGFGQGSVGAFSDFFRYKLLLERGGWWVDTDVVCLRPFQFVAESVLATEQLGPESSQLIAATSVIKQPTGSALMAWAFRACEQVDVSRVQWGDVGPRLLQRGVDALGLHAQLQPCLTFSPIPYYHWRQFIEPVPPEPFSPDVHAAHLYHQMWSHTAVDPASEFPESCLYEQWKRLYLDG